MASMTAGLVDVNADVDVKTTIALRSAIVVLTAYFSANCVVASVAAAASLSVLSDRINDLIQRRARAHCLARQFRVRTIVTANLRRLALHCAEFGNDLRFVLSHGLRHTRELRLQRRVFSLRSQCFGPVQREVEVAAAIVDTTANLARRRLVVVEEL